MIPLLVWLCSFQRSRSYCLTCGGKKERKKKPPAGFKLAKWVLLVFLAAAGWGELGFAFLPSCDFSGMGTRSGKHSSQLPSLQLSSSICCQAPVPSYTRPRPSVHQFCCPWGAPVRANSHTTFWLFVFISARCSQSLFRVVRLDHWVKSFWGLLIPWVLLLSSVGGAPSFLLGSQSGPAGWEHSSANTKYL